MRRGDHQLLEVFRREISMEVNFKILEAYGVIGVSEVGP